MKNVLNLQLQLTQTNISFCYGEKAYSKFMKKEHMLGYELENAGVTQTLVKSNGNFCIVVGVKTQENIYDLKGIIVHELSHTISEWMLHFGIDCDETRSYSLQFLYIETMTFLDDILMMEQGE